jgi:esterase/lipase superfamily enzyme
MLTLQCWKSSFADRIPGAATLVAILALAGCATTNPMMPTPTLYTGAQAKPLFTELPASRRSPPIDLLYLTDRAPPTKPDDPKPYTANRARSLAFGSTIVEFGDDVTWETLVKQSTAVDRSPVINTSLGPTKELGRFPPIPYQVAVTPQGLRRTPAELEAFAKAKKALQDDLARRLAASPRKEVVLFVHGYANSFVDAALTMGELCHFLGREFVCAIFTWPASGTRGVFAGYEVDYESSEFAHEHLRKALRMIADTPGLARLHLIAHSRGTDVLSSALAELGTEAYMEQSTLGDRFKIGNVVLAAPDIDADVAPTKIFRVLSDPDLPYGKAPDPDVVVKPSPGFHLTVYVSPDDKALATSGWLFGSLARLGRVNAAMFSPQDIADARKAGFFDVIQVTDVSGFIGHSYFHQDPRVSADIVALIRYGIKPNDTGRPLVEIAKPFWRVRTPDEISAGK